VEESEGTQRMNVGVTVWYGLSERLIDELSIGDSDYDDDDFDYDNAPQAVLSLNGEQKQDTAIELKDPDALHMYYEFYDLSPDQTHTIVVTSPTMEGEKPEQVEIDIEQRR
jgi:hypothetical protein